MLLTIGMATYDDFDGVYFSLQALKAYHDLEDVELVVVDTKPESCKDTANACNTVGAKYYHRPDKVGTSASRNHVFEVANGKFVMCIDCHVLLAKDSVAKLKEYIKNNLESIDLLQGPLLYDDQKNISTHFDPQWRGQMYGTWGTDQRYLNNEPFEIPMQGLGLFCMRKDAWARFNENFRGFGGEEGYIQEKVRQNGGKALCLPWLKWIHRFSRPKGVPYPLQLKDRVINYLIGWSELGWNFVDVVDFFKATMSVDQITECLKEFTNASGISIAISKFKNRRTSKIAYILDTKDSECFTSLNTYFPKESIPSKSLEDALKAFVTTANEYCLIVRNNEKLEKKILDKLEEWIILNQRQVWAASLIEIEKKSLKRKHDVFSYRIADEIDINNSNALLISKHFAELLLREKEFTNIYSILQKHNIKPFVLIKPESIYKINPHVTPLDNIDGDLEFGDIREIVNISKDAWCLEFSSHGIQSTISLCQKGKGVVHVDDYNIINRDLLKEKVESFGYANLITAETSDDLTVPEDGRRIILINHKNIDENLKFFAHEKQKDFLRKNDVLIIAHPEKEILDFYKTLKEYNIIFNSPRLFIAVKT